MVAMRLSTSLDTTTLVPLQIDRDREREPEEETDELIVGKENESDDA
jgi:hypothetical protein